MTSVQWSATEWICLLSAVGVAAVIQNIVGFGFALLAVPIMVLAVDPRDAVVVATILGLGSSGFQAWTGRQDAQWPLIKRLSLSAAAGVPFGLLVFSHFDAQILKAILGVGIFVAVILLTRDVTFDDSSVALEVWAGVVSGALSSSLSTNGPPLVFALQGRRLPIAQFRATISMIFAISGVITFGSFVALDKVTNESIWGAVFSLPILALGIFVGQSLKPKFNESNARKFVLLLLTVAGFSAVLSAFFG